MVIGAMQPIRLGIVGAGWGANHARVAAELRPLVEVRALCSRRHERMAALAAELGLPDSALEARWEDLVRRDDVDLVVVTAPDNLHHAITMGAIARGKHVFCEKPLAMSAAQAAEMLQAATAAGVAHFTGFTWRFAPPFATLRRVLQEGTLGPIRFIDGHFRIGPPLPGKEWQFDPEQRAGGVLGNLGVHLLDLVRYLDAIQREGRPAPSAEAWRVWASCRRAGDAGAVPAGQDGAAVSPFIPEAPPGPAGVPRGAGEARVEARDDWSVQRSPSARNDVCWLQLELDGEPDGPAPAGPRAPRLQARLQVSQLTTLRAPEPVRVEVHGRDATAIAYANPLFPERQRLVLVRRTSDAPEPIEPLDFPGGPPAPPTAALPSGGLLRPTIRHLYEAHIVPRLTGGTPARGTPTFVDGWQAQRLMDAALRSSDEGRWVQA
jgi:predicted dehydrogenase